MPGHGGIPDRVFAVVVAGILLSGCAIFGRKPPPAVPPPAVNATVRQFAGTPLSGPTADHADAIDLHGSMRIDVKWVAVDIVPDTTLPPLDTQSRLTFSQVNSDTFLATGMITRAARFGDDTQAREFRAGLDVGRLGKTSMVAVRSGMVAPGTTIQFDCADPPRESAPVRRVAFSISRPSVPGTQPVGATTRSVPAMIAIRVDDYARPRSESGSARPDQAGFGQETALLDDVSLGDGSTFALLVPMGFDGTPWRAHAALIDVHVAGNADERALALLQENVNQSMAAARAAASRPAASGGTDLSSAIAALGRSGGLRSPLLFLATQTDAAIAADFVLVANDSMLAKLADETKRFASAKAGWPPADKLGWQLDRSSLRLMAQSAAKPDTPPGITALLGLCAGEVGRHADSIEEVLKSVGDRKDLDRRLLAENLIFLEDNSPSARVRAFDWLNSRGKAPQGFDPLGSPKARRAAIDKALSTNGGTP